MRDLLSKAFQKLKFNWQKKMSFMQWRQDRFAVKNWFFLYLIYSSLLIDIIMVFCRDQKWLRETSLKVNYTNGLVLYYPFVSSRHHTMLVKSFCDNYLGGFKKFYGEGLTLRKDDVVIDIGAHVGTFAFPLFFQNPFIRIFAYEPDASNVRCLRQSLKDNAIDQNRFKIEALGVYRESGRTAFLPGGVSSRGSIVNAGFLLNDSKNAAATIGTVTLEDIFRVNNVEECALLKVDCEGSEYEIFFNTPDEVLARIRCLILEIHPVDRFVPQQLKDHLSLKGFDVRGGATSLGCEEIYCVRNDRSDLMKGEKINVCRS